MSRSKKYAPVCSISRTDAQKQFRTQENQAKRHKINQLLKVGTNPQDVVNKELILPSCKEYGNEWNSPRDGKHWLTKDIWKEQGYMYNKWLKK